MTETSIGPIGPIRRIATSKDTHMDRTEELDGIIRSVVDHHAAGQAMHEISSMLHCTRGTAWLVVLAICTAYDRGISDAESKCPGSHGTVDMLVEQTIRSLLGRET